MVSVDWPVESRGASWADACTAPATRLKKSSDRIIIEEVGFWNTYGQLYNRVSARNTPSFLKIELTRLAAVVATRDQRIEARRGPQPYSVEAGARKMRSLILE